MSKLEKYSSFKDSGIEWIGEIPEGWEISKLGTCLKPKSIKNKPNLTLLSITREKGIIKRDLDSKEVNHNFIPDDLSNYKLIEKGQFGMNKMKAWQGSYGISNFTGIVSPAYYIFDLNGIEPTFFHLAIRSNIYIPFFIQASDGVRIGQWDLSKSRMKEIPFFIPPKQEQIKIAEFLDTKTEQLGKVIKQKEQLIELLKERRKILINDAVTKGIDKTVEIKDSGFDWIGEIPDHWDITKLGAIVELKSDKNHPDFEVLSVYRDYGVIVKSSRDDNHNATSLDTSNYKAVDVGNLVVNKMKAWQGSMGISAYKGIVSPAYITCKIKSDSLINDYLHTLIRSDLYIGEYNRISYGVRVGQWDMHYEDFKQVPILLPPKDEQQEIMDYIQVNQEKIGIAISMQETYIEKIKEYKATLIDSVVTGKVKIL